MVDHVYKLDELAVESIRKEMFPDLIMVNQSTRTQPHYRDYYDVATKDIVYRVYRQDVRLFGFEF